MRWEGDFEWWLRKGASVILSGGGGRNLQISAREASCLFEVRTVCHANTDQTGLTSSVSADYGSGHGCFKRDTPILQQKPEHKPIDVLRKIKVCGVR